MMNGRPKRTVHNERRLYSREEAAHYLGISVGKLDGLARDGLLLPIKIGALVRFDKLKLDGFIDGDKQTKGLEFKV